MGTSVGRRSILEHQSWQEHLCICIAALLCVTQDTQTAANSSTNRVHVVFNRDSPQAIKSEKQKGHPATWVAFSSRENSSNGGENSVKTFWRNLMGRKRRVSRDFYELNAFIFNNLLNKLISAASVAI
jgi:hypothetical protein